MKVLIPRDSPKEESQARLDFEREFKVLQHLRGDDVRVPQLVPTNSNKVMTSSGERPCLVYDFIHAAQLSLVGTASLPGWIEKMSALTADSLSTAFASGWDTVCRMLDKNVRHLDIHPRNLLVRGGVDHKGVPYCETFLIDFGKAHLLGTSLGGPFVAPQQPTMMEPALQAEVIREKGAVSAAYLESPGTRTNELFALGQSFELWFDKLSGPEKNSKTGTLVREALDLLVGDKPYAKRRAAVQDCVNAMRQHPGDSRYVLIRTFQQKSARVDQGLLSVVDSPALQRLRKVLQLGTTHLLYPGATHNRFVHTLGVLELATQYLDAALTNDPKFVKDRKVALRAVQIYALLHDVGHYPFAHYLEEIDKTSLPRSLGSLHHETIAKRILFDPSSDVADLTLQAALKSYEPSFSKKWLEELLGTEKQRTALGRIVDGPIDCDKLDYLVRDSIACGVSYSHSVDIERLINSVTRTPNSTGGAWEDLGLTQKGVAAAEALAHARSQMYSEVYFHKACRAMAACIKKAFWLLAQNFDDLDMPMSEDQFHKYLFPLSDDQLLAFMSNRLKQRGQTSLSAAAEKLLDGPFLGGHRALYKRIYTLSNTRATEARSDDGYLFQAITSGASSYSWIDRLERALESRLTEHFRARPDEWTYSILIDVLPKGKATPDWPVVVPNKAGRPPVALHVYAPIVGQISEAMRNYQRVRVFAHPYLANVVRREFSDRSALLGMMKKCLEDISRT